MDKRWAPNQNYKVAAVPLDGGLDFVSPPSMVKPGTLTDCLNYETVDRNGYRRINGFYEWDNAFQFEDDRLFEVVLTLYTGHSYATKGDFLWSLNNLSARNRGGKGPFGILNSIVDNEDATCTITYWRINSGAEPIPESGTDNVRVWNSGGLDIFGTFATPPTPVAALSRLDIGNHYLTGDNTYGPAGRLIKYSDQDAASVSVTATGGPAITGLHYYNDIAYAVIDSMRLQVTSSVTLHPGDVIGDDNQAFILLNPENTTGSVWQSDAIYLHSWGAIGSTTGMTAPFGPREPSVVYLARLPSTSLTSFSVLDENTDEGQGNFGILHKALSIETINSNKPRPLNGVVLTNAGTGYTVPPIVKFDGGAGFGAKGVAIVNGGNVVSFPVTSGGSGYTFAGAPTVTVTGVGSSAAGTVTSIPWEYAGWRAVNTGWKFSAQNVSSASGFLTKVDRNRGPSSQVSAYSTGSSEGLPFALDSFNALNITGLPGTNITAQFGVAASTDPEILHEADSNRLIAGLRSSQFFGPFNTTPFGMRDFTSARDNIPTGSVVTGFEFNFTYHTNDFDSNTPPAASELVNYKAKAALYRRTVDDAGTPQYTLLSDIREVALTATGALEGPTPITIGASDDLWGVDGVTIDEITPDVGVAFWIEGVPTAGASFGYTFEVDTVNLEVSYRSPQVTYYFASGTGTERNVMSATLISYHRESGELTQNNWKGDWQVADLGVEKYCASGSVGLVKITDGGSGYTTAPTVTFNDPISGVETGAAGTAIIEDGKVVGVVITNGGTGYTSATTVTFSAPGAGTTATGTVVVGALPGIQSGMGIYLDSGLTTRIGFVSSDMEYNGLDSYTALEEEQSRYQIISANFYADEAWEGIYGVSGAGRAWYFDGNYFSRIYAVPLEVEESERKDKPRHICNYRFHLALGYKSGSVQFSKIGEPDNFDFVLGATEVGIGDRVTGIFPLPGQYLAVFCENSIWGITGKTVSEFSLENISPYSGAIEYSVVAIGDKPIYCDTMGISTLEQSDKYGNFLGNRLSHKVSPWLLPRLSKESSNNYGIITAYPVRNKNQYRVWFKDGYQLVMSLVGPEQEPQFTFTNYIFGGTQDESGTPPADDYETVVITNGSDRPHLLAVCSEVDKYGREQILFSLDIEKSRILENSSTTIRNFVYKADYTNQFSTYVAIVGLGEPTFTPKPMAIPAYFLTAFSTVENPFAQKTVRKARLEGTTRGIAALSLVTEKNYQKPDLAANTLTDVSLNNPDQLPINNLNEFKPASRIGNIAETDRVVVMQVANTTRTKLKVLNGTAIGFKKLYYTTRDPDSGSWHYCEPSHYVQLMLIQYEEGRQDA